MSSGEMNFNRPKTRVSVVTEKGGGSGQSSSTRVSARYTGALRCLKVCQGLDCHLYERQCRGHLRPCVLLRQHINTLAEVGSNFAQLIQLSVDRGLGAGFP